MAFKQSLTPSPYQQAVMDHAHEGTGSVIITAVAGSGKTKTIELCLPVIPEDHEVRCLAFNTTIAKELNARIDQLRHYAAQDRDCPWYGRQFRNVRASTFHSLGVGSVAYKLRCKVPELQTDSRKCIKLAEQHMNPIDFEIYGNFAAKLVGYGKGEGIGTLVPDSIDNWFRLIQHHDLYSDSEEFDETRAIELTQDLLRWSNKAAEGRYIDFDDQLYLPLLWNLRMFTNDDVLVDEAQDTNPVRRALVKKILKAGGRSYWFGDERQAINGFTGASHDSLDIVRREFNAIDLPLTVCYRCCKSVVAHAKQWVPYIEAHDAAPEGKVTEHMELNDAIKVLGDHDAVLCRNTAPLVSLALSLMARGRGCVVLGRDIGQGLISLVKKMRAGTLEALESKLAEFCEREVAKYMAKGEEGKAEGVSDRVACIFAIIEQTPEDDRSVGGLIKRVESMFRDDNGVLTLATVHKAKGKEWDVVGILRPDLMPSKWARQEWQYTQELNLSYVCATRAKMHLIYMDGDKLR